MSKTISLFALAVILISCNSTGSSAVNTGSSTVSTESRNSTGTDTSENSSVESNGRFAGTDVSSDVFSDVTGKEWKLSNINLANSVIIIDRGKLAKEGFGDAFTLNFDADIVSGKGEPNRYSAPYTRDNHKISIMLMRSTMMASIFPNSMLNEHEYFLYLQNVYEWKLVDKNLELLSKTADGSDARLVFE